MTREFNKVAWGRESGEPQYGLPIAEQGLQNEEGKKTLARTFIVLRPDDVAVFRLSRVMLTLIRCPSTLARVR